MALQLGSFLVAFSPTITLSHHVVGGRPILISLALVAAGFWLAGWLLLAVATSAVESSAALLFAGVIFQELSRYALVLSYAMFERTVRQSGPRRLFPLDDWSSALATGLGFGTMHVVMMHGSLLSASLGKATLFLDSCPDIPLVAITGVSAAFVTEQHLRARSWHMCALCFTPPLLRSPVQQSTGSVSLSWTWH